MYTHVHSIEHSKNVESLVFSICQMKGRAAIQHDMFNKDIQSYFLKKRQNGYPAQTKTLWTCACQPLPFASNKGIFANEFFCESVNNRNGVDWRGQAIRWIWLSIFRCRTIFSYTRNAQWGAVGRGGKCATHIRSNSRLTMSAFSKVSILFRMSTKEQNNH